MTCVHERAHAHTHTHTHTHTLTQELVEADMDTEAAHTGLPVDWLQLSRCTGLHSFMAVPITDGDQILGQLSVGEYSSQGPRSR